MYKNDGYVKTLSRELKLKVLAELTKGNHFQKNKFALTYGIQSSTINVWDQKVDRKI